MFPLKSVLARASIIILIIAAFLKAGSMYSDYSVLRYKQSQDDIIDELRKQVAIEVENNTTTTQENLVNMLEVQRIHEETIADINSKYDSRMRELEKRTDYYRSMSETNASTCSDLRDIATRFDRRLEEGGELVRELRARLVLRDGQIEVLGKQIMADRLLLGQEY